MTSGGERARHAFLTAGRAAAELLRDERLAAAWDEPSALAQWRVGGLAGHLARAVLTVPRYLTGEPPLPVADPVDATGYLLRALRDSDLDVDSDLAAAIRSRGDDEGRDGPEALAASVEAALAALRPLLGRGRGRALGTTQLRVLDGIAITLDAYLATRVVELVVHLDDLAVSIDRRPATPRHALGLAVDVLVDVARHRRGDPALLHVLARRERAPLGPLAL